MSKIPTADSISISSGALPKVQDIALPDQSSSVSEVTSRLPIIDQVNLKQGGEQGAVTYNRNVVPLPILRKLELPEDSSFIDIEAIKLLNLNEIVTNEVLKDSVFRLKNPDEINAALRYIDKSRKNIMPQVLQSLVDNIDFSDLERVPFLKKNLSMKRLESNKIQFTIGRKNVQIEKTPKNTLTCLEGDRIKITTHQKHKPIEDRLPNAIVSVQDCQAMNLVKPLCTEIKCFFLGFIISPKRNIESMAITLRGLLSSTDESLKATHGTPVPRYEFLSSIKGILKVLKPEYQNQFIATFKEDLITDPFSYEFIGILCNNQKFEEASGFLEDALPYIKTLPQSNQGEVAVRNNSIKQVGAIVENLLMMKELSGSFNLACKYYNTISRKYPTLLKVIDKASNTEQIDQTLRLISGVGDAQAQEILRPYLFLMQAPERFNAEIVPLNGSSQLPSSLQPVYDLLKFITRYKSAEEIDTITFKKDIFSLKNIPTNLLISACTLFNQAPVSRDLLNRDLDMFSSKRIKTTYELATLQVSLSVGTSNLFDMVQSYKFDNSGKAALHCFAAIQMLGDPTLLNNPNALLVIKDATHHFVTAENLIRRELKSGGDTKDLESKLEVINKHINKTNLLKESVQGLAVKSNNDQLQSSEELNQGVKTEEVRGLPSPIYTNQEITTQEEFLTGESQIEIPITQILAELPPEEEQKVLGDALLVSTSSASEEEDTIEEIMTPQEIHVYFQGIKAQQYNSQFNRFAVKVGWVITSSLKVEFKDVTAVEDHINGLPYYVYLAPGLKINESSISISNALEHGIRPRKKGQNGIIFIKNKVVELKTDSDLRPYTNKIIKNQDGELLIFFDKSGNHTDVKDFVKEQKSPITYIPG